MSAKLQKTEQYKDCSVLIKSFYQLFKVKHVGMIIN